MDKLTIQGHWFVDEQGRRVLLRGVNLGGSSKMPVDEPTHIVNTFANHRQVSFVGRPFPREEAHEHFARLRHWGFNVLRFLTTWEAIEHADPGVYDTDYLDYLTEMVALAGEYGLYVFIDPHQDVWSRMTGGDGAPGWTLEAAGFDISKLDLSEAAMTMQRRFPVYPKMVWTGNYNRLACQTMFSLFYAGKWLTPYLEVDGIQIQEFLQSHFIGAIEQVAKRIKDMPHVLGYGTLNEPDRGFIGLKSLGEAAKFFLKLARVTPADNILLGAGFPREIPLLEGDVHAHEADTVILNPHKISAWRSPEDDPWYAVGIWDFEDSGEPVLICDDYFEGIDFLRDGLIPFIKRYAEAMRQHHPGAIIFAESISAEAENFTINTADVENIVNAGHWYDERMLFTKSFDGETAMNRRTLELVKGRHAIAQLYKENIAELCQLACEKMGDIPTLIGEFGLAFDINDKTAFQDGDFSLHELALSLYYDAMDANLTSATLWNYTADNNNQWGDNWNQEDLSIFSRDQQTHPDDIHSGGRAVKGFCRPYVQRAGGEVVNMSFNYESADFTATINFPDTPTTETIIYVPEIWYGHHFQVQVSSGSWEAQEQTLIWHHPSGGNQVIKIMP